MLFHVSIDADEPKRVAEVIAEIWGGAAEPFPPVIPGSWIAMAGDDRNSAIEVYPRGTEFHGEHEEGDAYGVIGNADRRSATHFAMATTMSQDAVVAIAEREGWPVKYRKRGGVFGVLEVWLEGTRMIEVLTPVMQREYLEGVSIEKWRAMLAAGAPARQPVPELVG